MLRARDAYLEVIGRRPPILRSAGHPSTSHGVRRGRVPDGPGLRALPHRKLTDPEDCMFTPKPAAAGGA